MRLKTLRKKRPAFENEGAVINGSRMDLSNSEFKPAKYRTNNSFALPTSLNNDLSSLNISPSEYVEDTNNIHSSEKTTTSHRKFLGPSSSSQATNIPSYQAIEAACLEHGIRIHLDSSTAAAVNQQQNQTTENLTGRKSTTSSIQRHKQFTNKIPSRSSSAFNYSSNVQDPNQDLRPFSALQQTSTVDFDPTHAHNVSLNQPIDNQNLLQLPEQLNNRYCSSSIVASEHSDHITLSNQLAITNGEISTTTLIDNDPDLAYMSSLLQTANGDSFRDNIRRRAGLRGTFAVHRHPQTTTTTTTTYSKQNEKSSITHSSTNNHRNSLIRNSTIGVIPTTTTTTTTTSPSPKKIEKDILKHATRIRRSQLKDYLTRHQTLSKLEASEHISSISYSPTRTNYSNKRNKTIIPSESISLEPLELLLAPAPRTLPRTLPPSARVTSLLSHDLPAINRNSQQENRKSSKKSTKSPKNSFIENNNNYTHDCVKDCFSIKNENLSLLNDDSLPLMKTSPLDIVSNGKTHQSNSFDSGCYDRSSSNSSGDTRSITSLSINQASSSVPSARLTSASTRHSNITKKVSFEDQSRSIIVTTATYV